MPRSVESLTPFKLGWWSFDLRQYRPCDSTYCLYPYESLPPIAPVDESLAWLGPLADSTDRQMRTYRNPPDERGSVVVVAAEAARLGLTLPDSFFRLMASPDLQDRIPSCTACYFTLSEAPNPCFGSEDGYVIRFLSDQQGVLMWYLYLTRQGEHCVLAAPTDLQDLTEPDAHEWAEANRQAIVDSTYVCAPSFAEFVYRLWLENTLWFKLDDGATLTPAEHRYLAHYSTQPAH